MQELEETENLAIRYGLEASADTAEDYLEKLAQQRYQDDKERCAQAILNDFRQGLLGPIALELPPDTL